MDIAQNGKERGLENIKLFFRCYPTAKCSTYWVPDGVPDDEK